MKSGARATTADYSSILQGLGRPAFTAPPGTDTRRQAGHSRSGASTQPRQRGYRGRRRSVRNRRGSSGSYAAGVESRPEGVRRSTGGGYVARRKKARSPWCPVGEGPRSTPLIGRCLGEEVAIAPPLRRCSPWKRFGRAALDPYLTAPGHWEQDPRIPLMAKPEKPNNGFSIGTPQVRAQGFRGPGRKSEL